MKKSLLVLGLALSLIFAFAAVAMANTLTLDPAASLGDGKSDYASPTTPNLGGYTTGTTRIHSNYQQNTNACAACHAIHTAAGEMLLQWQDDQATCEACHNGSLGTQTYNVFAGTIGTGAQTWGGAFSTSAASASMHNVGDGVAIGTAPGGDLSGVYANSTSKWNAEFTCTSCHDPHGTGGNGRILNPKVNGANYVATTAQDLLLLPGTTNTYVARVPVVYGDYSNKNATLGEYAKLLGGHGNDLTVYDGTNTTALKEGINYDVDNSGDFTKIVFKTALTGTPNATFTAALRVKMNVSGYLTDAEKVTYIKGMNDFCGACHIDYNTSTFNRTQAVTLNKTTGAVTERWADQGMPYYVKGSDPTTKGSTYDTLNGTYHEAYRHAVGRFSGNATQVAQGLAFERINLTNEITGTSTEKFVFVCTTCHVAHGANETVWQNFKTQGGTSTGNYKGISDAGIRFDGPDVASTGSRLKRMPNMATCETCHAKGPGSKGIGY